MTMIMLAMLMGMMMKMNTVQLSSVLQNHHLSYNEKKVKENLNLAFFSRFSSQFNKGEDGDDQTQHLLEIIRTVIVFMLKFVMAAAICHLTR